MLDTPGLCAPEVVAAEKKLQTTRLAEVIAEVQPDWLVLRPLGADSVRKVKPRLLTETYFTVKVFDASERVASYHWLPGRGYLLFDQKFIILKRSELNPQHLSFHHAMRQTTDLLIIWGCRGACCRIDIVTDDGNLLA